MGSLYQLQTSALPGQLMIVGGPYDTYGRVIALRPDGYHLVRGLGHAKPTDWRD